MAQSGYTPLSLYYSATASNTPTAGNLVAGELALNTADGKLFYKDSSGNVQVLASKAGSVNVSSFSGGTTGLTPNTATTGAVTLAGTLAVANGGTGVTTSTGSGNNVLSTSPTLVTPVLGTPTSVTLTNATGLPVGGITATGTPSSTTYLRGDGSWSTVSATPGGSTTQVQYNNAGAFAGSANMTFDGSTLTTLNSAYTGTLTGGTGIVNLGSGQFYKDASGNVGIGTNSPQSKLDVSNGTLRAGQAGTVLIGRSSSSFPNTLANGYFSLSTNNIDGANGGLTINTLTSDVLTEKMRIDSSGNLLVGSTAYNLTTTNTQIGATGISNNIVNGFNISLNKPSGDPQTAFQTFFWAGGLVGYIAYNGSGVSYVTTSDARLKENIVDSGSAINVVNDIKVRSFDWVSESEHDDFGFVAQELYETYPKAVTKQKNKEDGSMDMPWGVDFSKLVPVLVKAIQEQQVMIEELKAKVAALEAK